MWSIFAQGVLPYMRVNFLGARGIEAVIVIDHTRGNQVALQWLLYDGHGNLVRTLSPDYTLSAFQWRGVWGEGRVHWAQAEATARTWVIRKTRQAWCICVPATTNQRRAGLFLKTLHGTE